MIPFNRLLACIGIASEDTRIVHEITTCHKRAREGVLFVAMRGFRFDSNTMIGAALAQGAMVVGNVEQEGAICVEDSRVALALMAEEFYGQNHRFLTMIGITGTSGKSSVSHYIAQLLRFFHRRVCVIGSDGVFMEEKHMPTSNTTPSSLFLSRTLQECVKNNIEYVVMEVSSHASEQGRVSGIYFDEVLFLNLGHDHLDYHPSLLQYRESKAKLLYQLKPDGVVIVNGDDKELLSLLEESRHRVAFFGQTFGELHIGKVKLGATGSEFEIISQNGVQNELEKAVRYQTRLIGLANVYNTVAAISSVHLLGFSLLDVKSGVEDLVSLSGRMQIVYQKDFSVIVDYAHTVDAFAQLAEFVQALDCGRRIIVMGLGGDRDKTKRPRIGKIVYDAFDVMIMTSDNPRSEDPLHIIADVCAQCGYDKAVIEVSRQRAIQLAIQGARIGDIIVIAGKGNEQFQQIGDVQVHFVDEEVIGQALTERFP